MVSADVLAELHHSGGFEVVPNYNRNNITSEFQTQSQNFETNEIGILKHMKSDFQKQRRNFENSGARVPSPRPQNTLKSRVADLHVISS